MGARKMLAKFVDKSAINFKINDRKKRCDSGENTLMRMDYESAQVATYKCT